MYSRAVLFLIVITTAACSDSGDTTTDTTTVTAAETTPDTTADSATRATPDTADTTGATAESDDDHSHGGTTTVPLGTSLSVAAVAEPVDVLDAGLAPFVVHDRHRAGVAFSGATDSEHVFFAGIVKGEAVVFDAAPQFAAVGSVTVVPQFAALCVDSIYGVVDAAVGRYMARVSIETRRELATTPLADGGGPVSCGGSVTVIAGAGRRTLGVDSAHGHLFWELPLELLGQAAVDGALAVVPTFAGVLGIETRDGDELWRQDGALVGRPVVTTQGVWLEFDGEFRLLSRSGVVTATFERDALMADIAEASSSGAADVEFGLAGSAGAPLLFVLGTDLVLTPDGQLSHVIADAKTTTELLGPSEGLIWALRRAENESERVELLDVDGAVVATIDVDATFEPIVATDQFVVGRTSTGLVFVRRD